MYLFIYYVLTVVGVISQLPSALGEEPKNVFGQPLQSCSSPGMALTGSSTGYCEDGDFGSRHICIDLSSTNGGNLDFCTVTQQLNWCSSWDMACQYGEATAYDGSQYGEVSAGGSCSVQNWCVDQWDFAAYLERVGGCEHIQGIHCEAVNRQALIDYGTYDEYKEARECIQNMACGF